jgi:hypothetical protein
VLAQAVELKARAGDKVRDGRGHEDLPGTRSRGYARRDRDRDPCYLAPLELRLAEVKSGADLEAELANGLDGRCGAAHGGTRRVEGDEEAVAGRVDLAAVEPLDLPADRRVVEGLELSPPLVADLDGDVRGADDIGEQECLQCPRLSASRHRHSLAACRALLKLAFNSPSPTSTSSPVIPRSRIPSERFMTRNGGTGSSRV